MEQYKRKDKEFFEKSKVLEKSYEGFVQSLSAKVEALDFSQIKVNFERVHHSREGRKAEEEIELPEPGQLAWQASSTTENLANWVHADKQLME